ncbi:hypothetical protein HRbin33_00550 [bacterium HR33]|nr:hypothetical protein HRbin33_00550 [bacterium HR33]
MPNLRGNSGIALPVTIFVISLLTIMLAASFVRVDAERTIAVSGGESVTAIALAQSGLHNYIASRTSRPPDGDSVRFNLTGGYADVVAHIVQRPADTLQNQVYIVRSTGYVIVPERGAVHQGARTVAQFAVWQTGVIRRIAAFVAANRVRTQSGGRIDIDGRDFCGPGSIGSVRARNGSRFDDGTYRPSPPVIRGSGDQVADTTGIDWNYIVNGGFVADYYSLSGSGFWKSYLIRGDATLNSGTVGTGILIVTGDLTTTGNRGRAEWYGIVLVGGKIDFNARRTRFRGLVYSGLNELLGGPAPPDGTIGGGGGGNRYEIEYWSCYVDNSLASLTGFVAIPNAWVENWASY